MTISSAGMKTTLRFPLLAEALGCMTEQMAYIHIGLPAATPRPERIRQLGEIVGEVWYRSLPPVS